MTSVLVMRSCYASKLVKAANSYDCGRSHIIILHPRSSLASHADILLARHAIREERLRDEPKECLRRRLGHHVRRFEQQDQTAAHENGKFN